jgi:hypothetical protein
MLSRRLILLAPAAQLLARAAGSGGKMTLSLHQNTSAGAGFRGSLEGWARAGIKNVEITSVLLDEFLKTDTIAAAGRLISDLGLTVVSSSCGVGGLWEPNPNRAASLDMLRKRCEMFASLGIGKTYASTGTTQKFVLDDYKAGAQNMHEGDRQTIPHDRDGRIHPHIHIHLDADDTAEDDARGGAPESPSDAGLLSFLVRAE